MASLLSEIDVIGNLHKTFFGNQKSEQLVKMGSFFIQLAIGENNFNGQRGCVTSCG